MGEASLVMLRLVMLDGMFGWMLEIKLCLFPSRSVADDRAGAASNPTINIPAKALLACPLMTYLLFNCDVKLCSS